MIEVIRGDDNYVVVPVTADGTPVNLLNATELWFTLKAGQDDDLPILVTKRKTEGDITVADDVTDNNVTVHLESADLAAALSPYSIWWGELQVKESGGRISTPWRGAVKIAADSQVATT